MSGRRPRACRTRSAEAVFFAETSFHWPRQILVASGENVIAALDERHLRTNALKELGQFDGDGTAAEDEEALRLLA